MKIVRTSPFSGKTHTWDLPVTEEELRLWENGKPAQYAFPHLSANQREFIMTGITPDEWEETFGGD
jgi:hypothetical protein